MRVIIVRLVIVQAQRVVKALRRVAVAGGRYIQGVPLLAPRVIAQPGTDAAVGIENDVDAAQVIGPQETDAAAVVHGCQLAAEEVMLLDRSGSEQVVLVQFAQVNGALAVVAAQDHHAVGVVDEAHVVAAGGGGASQLVLNRPSVGPIFALLVNAPGHVAVIMVPEFLGVVKVRHSMGGNCPRYLSSPYILKRDITYDSY
jgi:hypothetical protein